jgi:hypothetical protein
MHSVCNYMGNCKSWMLLAVILGRNKAQRRHVKVKSGGGMSQIIIRSVKRILSETLLHNKCDCDHDTHLPLLNLHQENNLRLTKLYMDINFI